MRYPVGFRPTMADAIEAAREASTMTGLRYRTYYVGPPVNSWQFEPRDTPNPERHEAVRV